MKPMVKPGLHPPHVAEHSNVFSGLSMVSARMAVSSSCIAWEISGFFEQEIHGDISYVK